MRSVHAGWELLGFAEKLRKREGSIGGSLWNAEPSAAERQL